MPVAVGIGWESSSFTAEAMGTELTLGTSGFELAMLQGGVDFRVHDAVALGPFLGFTLARFSSVSCDAPISA